MRKKFLSMALVCVMVLGMLPVNAFAAETGDASTDANLDSNNFYEYDDLGTNEGIMLLSDGETVAKIGEAEYTTLAAALEDVGAGKVVIELVADAELNYGAREAYGTEETTSLTINGNDNKLTLKQTDSDWSSIGLENTGATLVLKDMTIDKPTAPGNGAWNNHAINFTCSVALTDVTVNNSISVENGATLDSVTINETGSYYGLWIKGNGQKVSLTGGEINATNGGRGIKIADQYIDDPASVTLTVSGTEFNTAKKAAVLVSSEAGAEITVEDADISKVAEDSENFVWVDEDYSDYYKEVSVSGDGTLFQEGSIKIGTVEDLQAFAEAVNSGTTYEGETVVLTADIDLSEVENWTPIGNSTNCFWGTFDGQGHTISNMTININDASANQYAGLFGSVKKATVKNLTVKDAKIDVVGAKAYAGAVFGIAHSNSENRTDATLNFENITVDGCTINAESKSGYVYVGGFAGYCYPANMTDISVSDLTLNPKASSSVFVGGMVGYMQGQNIYNNGNTRAYYTVEDLSLEDISIKSEATDILAGGFAGYTYYGYITMEDVTIDGFTAEITGTSTRSNYEAAIVGGLIGLAHRSDKGHTFTGVDIDNLDIAVSNDSGMEVYAGGLVGYSGSPIAYSECEVEGTITETCSNGDANSSAFAGGLVGATVSWAQSYTDCVADVDVNGTNVAGGFVGYNSATTTYTDCEASGTVVGTTAGGFVGNDYATKGTYIECAYTGESEVPFSGTEGVTSLSYVAQIGEERFTTLQAAIDKADDGDTIKLIDNIDITDVEPSTLDGSYDTYALVEGKSITIDLNGKTISGEYTGTRMLVGVFSTDKNGHLTLTGNGTVDIKATNKVYSLIACYNDGSSITIENGTYKLDSASDSLIFYGGYTDAALTVNGGTFNLGNVGTGENGKPWIFNVLGAGDHHVKISGGSFNADINHQHWSNEAVVDETCYVTNADGIWTVNDGAVAHVKEGMVTGPYYAPKNVGYATFEEAVAAAVARNDKPVTLLEDIVVTAPIDASATEIVQNGKSITLEENGSLTVAAEAKVSPEATDGYELVTTQNADGSTTYSVANKTYDIQLNGAPGTYDGTNYHTKALKKKLLDEEIELSDFGFSRFGYHIAAWNGLPVGKTYTVAELLAVDKNPSDDKIYLYAAWEPNQYAINFNGDGGTHNGKNEVYITSSDKYTVGYEDTITFADVLSDNDKVYSKLGFVLAGWSIGAGSNVNTYALDQEVTVAELLQYDSKPNDGTIRVTAVWEPGDYILNFNGGAGKNNDKKVLQVNVKSTDKVVLGDIDGNYIREGYALVGWDSGSTGHEYDLTSEYVVLDLLKNDKNPNDNTIYLSAMWTPKTSVVVPTAAMYRTEYWQQKVDGTYEKIDVQYKTGKLHETATAVYDAPKGFKASADSVLEGTVVTPNANGAASIDDVEMLTLVVKYEREKYTLTFNAGDHGTFADGKTVNTVEAAYGTAFPAAPALTAEKHFEFTGWDPELPATVPVDGGTYTANWKQVSTDPAKVEPAAAVYFVEHWVEDENGEYILKETETLSAKLGATVTADSTKYVDTYHRVDTANSTLEGVVSADLTAEKPYETLLTLKVYYEKYATDPAEVEPVAAVYKVEHYVETLDGTYVLDDAMTVQKAAVLNTELKAADFVQSVTGYHLNDTKSVSVNVEKPVMGTDAPVITTLKVYYDLDRYTVSFESNGGTEVEAQTVQHGAKASKPADPTKADCTFQGWYSDSDLTTEFSFDTEITADTTIYAKWNIDTTGITLNKSTASLKVGNTVTLISTVTPDNATDKAVTWASSNASVATVDPDGTVTAVAAGTATITATASGGQTADCTVTVTRTSSGGGGGGSTSYAIIVEDTENGEITVSSTRASSGSTVTITVDPDSGYELDELTVLDKNGKEIKLTKKSDSKYTFKMPSSKVTIEATFAEIEEYENPFVDVAEGAYYYDAVLWAAENGITGGTSATTFSPAVTCTRAQTVTFLWRAAGSPDPEDTNMPFTDVAEGAYYYDAVLWAVENGITSGTSTTTFSPNATVTRAQNVTFLWRWAESPAAEQANPFVDVAEDKYYHDAVIWAAEQGITAGTTAITFSPDDPCLRSQIVTFLYRYLAK